MATQLLELALALEPEPFDRCEALNALGDVARYQADYEQAVAALAEAIELARTQEDWFHPGASLHNVGTVALDRGEYDQAQAALEESLPYARQEKWYLACSALHYLGWVAFEQGDYDRAAALRREELAVQRTLAPTAPLSAGACLEGIAQLAVVQHVPAPAARLFGAAATLRERAEDIEHPGRTPIAPWVAAAREELGEEAFTGAWAAGRALSLEDALVEAAGLLASWSWTASSYED